MGLRHSSGCKIRSAGDNVPATTQMSPADRHWCGGEAVVDFQVDFQTEGEGATLCIGSVQDTCMAANGLGAPVPNGESENVTGPAYRGRFIGNM